MLDVIYPVRANVRTGKRVLKTTPVDKMMVDRSTGGIELDLVEENIMLTMDDRTAFELVMSLLGKISPLVFADHTVSGERARDRLKKLADKMYEYSAGP